MARYVFDSNEFINLQRRQPIDIIPSLWKIIEEKMVDGIIVSSQEVYEELLIGDDELQAWAKARKEYFMPSTVEIQQVVREILKENRGLVEGGKKKNSADPFVIALARQEKCKVVTEEAPTHSLSAPKIPDVCSRYNIECISFVTFAREIQIRL